MRAPDLRACSRPPVRRHWPLDREELPGVQQRVGGLLDHVHSVLVMCRIKAAHRTASVNVSELANRTYLRIVAPVAVATRSAPLAVRAVKASPVIATKSVSLAESCISPSTVREPSENTCQYAEAPNAVEVPL